jgi:hypothetical protein
MSLNVSHVAMSITELVVAIVPKKKDRRLPCESSFEDEENEHERNHKLEKMKLKIRVCNKIKH